MSILAASNLAYAALGVAIALEAVSAVVTALKRKWWFFGLGFAINLLWYIGAIRLAKPDSYWARRFYSPTKMANAQERFASTVDH